MRYRHTGKDTLKNDKNIVFLSNTGSNPLTKHKATKPAFTAGPSSARQRNAIDPFQGFKFQFVSLIIIFWGSKHLCVLIHIWTKGEVSALLKRFKPSSKIFYWPFQGGTFLCIFYVFFLSCDCYAFVRVCL